MYKRISFSPANLLLIACLFLSVLSCGETSKKIDIPAPKQSEYAGPALKLTQEAYYDKVLGALVGSAVGDAMGASTEMWHRNEIRLRYGYITGLTPAIREQSPEGTWDHNLMAGATTDDTRWKLAMTAYLTEHPGNPAPEDFADFIVNYYTHLTQELSEHGMLSDTDRLDTQIEKIDWIKEWARVAMAYREAPQAYQKALNRFYGGEMSCAGQLYTPMFGLVSENPETAYGKAYDHALFDIGYAKDISGLVAAMTQMALRTSSMDSIIATPTFIDPIGYQDSRLVGRIPLATADAAVRNVLAINNLILADTLSIQDSIKFKIPQRFPGNQKDWIRQETIYGLLEKDEKAIAFHAGEIWQILVTALKYGGGDFEKTMQFIVNYGRDNDTVAAVAGTILGAKDGYSNLPVALRTETLRVNKEFMGIDLEAMARKLTDTYASKFSD